MAERARRLTMDDEETMVFLLKETLLTDTEAYEVETASSGEEAVIKIARQPFDLIIAAAGSIEHEDFVAQVRDAFWRMLGQGSPSPSRSPSLPFGGDHQSQRPLPTLLRSGRQGPLLHLPDRYGLQILNDLLGGGISSRLFRHLREERGLVYNVASSYHAYRDGGLLVIEGSTTPQDLMSVLGLTVAQLWRLAEEPVYPLSLDLTCQVDEHDALLHSQR